jgi:flagellar biosynthesis chaperone FliJ
MDMAEYVAQENVKRFRQELENGAEGKRQDMMLRLLVEEENKVGLTNEQLDEMHRQIGRINQIISAQLETLTMLRAAGHSVERAEESLTKAIHLLVTYEAHRTKIERALSGSRTLKQP